MWGLSRKHASRTRFIIAKLDIFVTDSSCSSARCSGCFIQLKLEPCVFCCAGQPLGLRKPAPDDADDRAAMSTQEYVASRDGKASRPNHSVSASLFLASAVASCPAGLVNIPGCFSASLAPSAEIIDYLQLHATFEREFHVVYSWTVCRWAPARTSGPCASATKFRRFSS